MNINIALLTVTDTRTLKTDKSGNILSQKIKKAKHNLMDRKICKDNKKDVQNIDLMNLAGFCRNCLSRWYREEAETKGINISDLDAREYVYGMPYSEWKEKYQK